MSYAVACPIAAALALLPGAALAHVQLESPLQREAAQKQGPCGSSGSGRSDNVCTYRPGATITVTWDETIEHPGHFRISFDQDGDDDFVVPTGYDDVGPYQGVLVDDIADRDVRGGDPGYSQEIQLPDVECDSCTLQLIQVMTDKPPYGNGDDIYYQCADIVLSASAPADPAAACSTGGGGADDDGGPADEAGEESGCAMAGSGGPLAWLLPLLLAALALRARR
jgi:Lytic polysaccharide mono-oxygenase, cellulose-degrading